MLRKSILVTSSWMVLGAAASAADLPAAAPIPPVVAPGWAGFYLGGHGGYGWGDNNFRIVLTPDPVRAYGGVKSRGALYGAQAGYNWQYGRAVGGLEIDFSAANIGGDVDPLFSTIPQLGDLSVRRSDRLKYLGSARGRLGWLPTDNVLLYGTAGAAWERVDEVLLQAVGPPTNLNVSVTTPFDRFGWVGGVGVEAMPFGPNWIARLEYLHYDFGVTQRVRTVTANVPGLSLADRGGHQTFDMIRAGLSYKFGTPAANPAVYAKAPVLAETSGWAGFYLGAHGGYGWGENKFSLPLVPNFSISGARSSGGVYGGQAGYNWQFDRAVAGFELDFSGAEIKGRSQLSFPNPPATSTAVFTGKSSYLGSLRGRLGWLPTNNVLLYGTAGLGWERLDRITANTAVVPAGTSNTVNYTSSDRFGWVAGVGVETMLAGTNWIGRVEYLHYGFGAVEISGFVTAPNGTSVATAGNHGLDIVRAGVSYKFGEPAQAAPVRYAKAPPVVAPTARWAGFYLGGHGGYGWKNDDFSQVVNFGVPRLIDSIKSQGWLAGGQVGYNWQYGRAVAGLEIDFSFSDIKGTSAPLVQNNNGLATTDTLSDRVKNLASARARLGWAPIDNVLLFATAGPAWERLERTLTNSQFGNLIQTTANMTPSDHFGAVVGAGAEWMPFGPNWVGRVEYLHYDFGKFQDATTFTSTVAGNVPYSERRGRQTIEAVRAGVSYKFD
jgi:opacity protein-like surface antigen